MTGVLSNDKKPNQLLCWKVYVYVGVCVCVRSNCSHINYVDDIMRWQNRSEYKWWGVAICRNVLNTNSTQIMLMAQFWQFTFHLHTFWRPSPSALRVNNCDVSFVYLFTELMNKLVNIQYHVFWKCYSRLYLWSNYGQSIGPVKYFLWPFYRRIILIEFN